MKGKNYLWWRFSISFYEAEIFSWLTAYSCGKKNILNWDSSTWYFNYDHRYYQTVEISITFFGNFPSSRFSSELLVFYEMFSSSNKTIEGEWKCISFDSMLHYPSSIIFSASYLKYFVRYSIISHLHLEEGWSLWTISNTSDIFFLAFLRENFIALHLIRIEP